MTELTPADYRQARACLNEIDRFLEGRSWLDSWYVFRTICFACFYRAWLNNCVAGKEGK